MLSLVLTSILLLAKPRVETHTFRTSEGKVQVAFIGEWPDTRLGLQYRTHGHNYVRQISLPDSSVPGNWSFGMRENDEQPVCGLLSYGRHPAVWVAAETHYYMGVFLYRFTGSTWKVVKIEGLPDDFTTDPDGYDLCYSRGSCGITKGRLVFADSVFDETYCWSHDRMYAGLIELRGNKAVVVSHFLTKGHYSLYSEAEGEFKHWKYGSLLQYMNQPTCRVEINDEIMSTFLGHRLGDLTTEDVEHKLGRGRVVIGGHPNSGRCWALGNGSFLATDGFDYRRGRTLINYFDLSGAQGHVGEVSKSETWFTEAPLGCLKWGDSFESVCDSLYFLNPTKSSDRDSVHILKVRLKSAGTNWDVQFRFSTKGLTEIHWVEI